MSRRRVRPGREITRCLKRYVAREVLGHLVRPGSVPLGGDVRQARLSLANVAATLSSPPNRVSELERGVRYDTDLTLRDQAMLAGINSSAAGIDNVACQA